MRDSITDGGRFCAESSSAEADEIARTIQRAHDSTTIHADGAVELMMLPRSREHEFAGAKRVDMSERTATQWR